MLLEGVVTYEEFVCLYTPSKEVTTTFEKEVMTSQSSYRSTLKILMPVAYTHAMIMC